MEKLVLIDGNSLINRAFYAMPVLSTKNGTPTNAVLGFMNMFFKMLDDIKPTFIAVAFDLKAPTFRHNLYSDYKGTRKPMPEELRPQIPLLKEVLSLMGIRCISLEGYEADDIIGTIAKHTKIQTIIFTGDKDSFQLVDDETEVHFTKRGISDVEVFNHLNFTEKTSITPSQIIELKALMGDSSDNIPGVKGVGEKTAYSLLHEYQTIENLYANTEKLSGKLKEKIVDGKNFAFLSKALATIDVNAPIDTNLDTMRFSFPFSTELKRKFVELEFKSLIKKEAFFSSDENEKETEQNSKVKPITSIVVDTLDQSVFDNLSSPISLYVSTDLISICDGNILYDYKINRTLLDGYFNNLELLNHLNTLFTGDKTLIVWNKKSLRHYLKKNADLTLSCPCIDLSLMKYLADFSGKEESEADLFLSYDLDANSPAHSLYLANGILSEKLKQEDLVSLYEQVELPLSDVLYEMEESGFKIDYQALSVQGEKYKLLLSDLDEQIKILADQPTLNINSPKQLGELIFEKLKLAKGKKTKTGYSTSAEILESLEDTHPIVPLILKYRKIAKLYSTYIDGFKPLIDKTTGLIHTSFNQTVTATGRLSSKEPNLQNIPVRDEEGNKLRKFFVPKSADRVLIGADYSQIELRLLADFSKCKDLIDAFNSEKDIHSQTASLVFNTPIEKVTKTMRSSAKAVNFGIIYGISEYGLAKQLKISNAKAKEYITSYFETYPEVKEYMDNNVDFALKNGYAKTILNRKRYIRELLSPSYMVREFGKRIAMNMPLQGSSADIIKLAMINVSNRLKKENLKSQLILQVHDELIIDAFKSESEMVKTILKEEMENAVELSVPLTVEVGEGDTWFDTK